MPTPSVSIRRRRPLRTVVVVLVALGALAAGGLALHRERLAGLTEALDQARQSAVRWEQEGYRLRAENRTMRERLLGLERAKQVERQAYDEVDAHLRELQDQILALKREVAFYQSIMSGEGGNRLAVQTFVLVPETARTWRYELVLTRGMNDGKVARGTVNLAVSGEHEGSQRRLDLAQMSAGAQSAVSYRFKYFQRLEGRFELPDAFVPRQVHVIARPASGGGGKVERVFDWPAKSG